MKNKNKHYKYRIDFEQLKPHGPIDKIYVCGNEKLFLEIEPNEYLTLIPNNFPNTFIVFYKHSVTTTTIFNKELLINLYDEKVENILDENL